MEDERRHPDSGRQWVRAALALAFIILMVAHPKSLFSDRGLKKPLYVHKVTRLEPMGHGWVYETLRVYAVLKSHHTELSDFSAWTIAKAVAAESRRHEIDPMLILAIIKVESRFRPDAQSPKGARGLMQILPFVGRSLAREVELSPGQMNGSLHDPVLNVRLGVHYLMKLRARFDDLRLALVAYNRGPTYVRKVLRDKKNIRGVYADKVLAARDFFNRLTPSLLANRAE